MSINAFERSRRMGEDRGAWKRLARRHTAAKAPKPKGLHCNPQPSQTNRTDSQTDQRLLEVTTDLLHPARSGFRSAAAGDPARGSGTSIPTPVRGGTTRAEDEAASKTVFE